MAADKYAEVRDKTKEALAIIARATALDLKYLGEVMLNEAKKSPPVPVDTGNLMRSIAMNSGENWVTVKTETGYGAYVEFGTSKMAAQPFLAPSYQIAMEATRRRIEANRALV